jgi:hypothetical protein
VVGEEEDKEFYPVGFPRGASEGVFTADSLKMKGKSAEGVLGVK